jgi:hypothetical protein
MDRISLMHQLGHSYLNTTASFLGSAVGQWRAQFDACQELARS